MSQSETKPTPSELEKIFKFLMELGNEFVIPDWSDEKKASFIEIAKEIIRLDPSPDWLIEFSSDYKRLRKKKK